MRVVSAAIVFLAAQVQPCTASEPECVCPPETTTAPGPQPIRAVPTSVAGFVGFTEQAGSGVVSVTSMKAFQSAFGGADSTEQGFALHPSMSLFFANGGAEARVVSVGTYDDPPTRGAFEAGLRTLAGSDATLIAIPDAASTLTPADLYGLQASMMDHCATQRDRFCLLDLPNGDPLGQVSAFRGAFSAKDPSWGAAYVPWLETTDGTLLPPSAAMAGVFARIDRSQGVWRSPANVTVNGIAGLASDISDQEQDTLILDTSTGLSVNPIRTFPSQGPLVWGARTLAGNDAEWQYISVRRLGTFVEQSLDSGLDWVVFEPNDEPLWAEVAVRVETFLRDLWTDGALVGATPSDAFFVRVGLDDTMTQADIDAGRVIVTVGFAAARPAEFTVLNVVKEAPKR